MQMPVDAKPLTAQDSAMNGYADRTDKMQLRKAERMIQEGGDLMRAGYRLKRSVSQRVLMRARRAEGKA